MSEQGPLPAEAHFSAVIAAVSRDAIVVGDSRGLIVHWNAEAERMLGYSAGEVLSRPLTLIMPERMRPHHEKSFRTALAHAGAPLSTKHSGNIGDVRVASISGVRYPLPMPRLARLDAPGTLHHVMARGITRQKIFWEDPDRDDFLLRVAGLVEAKAPHQAPHQTFPGALDTGILRVVFYSS